MPAESWLTLIHTCDNAESIKLQWLTRQCAKTKEYRNLLFMKLIKKKLSRHSKMYWFSCSYGSHFVDRDVRFSRGNSDDEILRHTSTSMLRLSFMSTVYFLSDIKLLTCFINENVRLK